MPRDRLRGDVLEDSRRRWPHHEGGGSAGGDAMDVDARLRAPPRTLTHGYEPTREAAMAAVRQELAAGIGRVLINAQIAAPSFVAGSATALVQKMHSKAN